MTEIITQPKHSIFNEHAFENFIKEHKIQPYRKKQIFHEIFKNAVINFEDMSNLAKDLRTLLSNNFFIIPFELEEQYESPETTKFLFRLSDNNVIESVLMFHFHEIVE
jgi:23S rRNA (adenine2503-C2)-methyltransferase